MNSLAASGGYYVACGGKYLMANDTTITGSIGVIIQTLNYEQLFNKVGLASVVFKSGKFKDMLNGARPMTPEEREYVQGFVMGTYEKFLGIVAKERNLPADALRTTIADGRILSGTRRARPQADRRPRPDRGRLPQGARAGRTPPDATVVKYGPPFALGRLFRALGESAESKIELDPAESAHAAARIGPRLLSAELLRSLRDAAGNVGRLPDRAGRRAQRPLSLGGVYIYLALVAADRGATE